MYRKEKKIPTLLGLFLILAGIGLAIFFDRSSHTTLTSAKNVPFPEDVHFTNINDNSFTVSWLTQLSTVGAVEIVKNGHKQTLLDDLDSDNIPRPRTNHYVTVKELNERTSYDIKILNGKLTCGDTKICPIYSQSTAVRLSSYLKLPPVHGVVIDQQGKSAAGAIIYLTINKTLPLSGRVDSSGLWVIPLNNLRIDEISDRPEVLDEDVVQIVVKLSSSQTATAITDIKSIKDNLPLPEIKIGNSYNFTDLKTKRPLFAKNNSQAILGESAEKPTSIPSLKTGFSINFPNIESVTPDTRPRLRGTGVPGSQLLITINSSPQTGKVIVGKDGTWSFRPEKTLSAGPHQLVVQGYDATGKLTSITRKFFVLKSGERVLGEATPSASLTPTSTPVLNTPTPSISVSLTPLPSLSPTIIPSPTIAYVSPTISITIPRSGNITSSLLFISGSSILFAAGLALIFLF